MKLFNRVTYNSLVKQGYNKEQIIAILASSKPALLCECIDTSYAEDEIREVNKIINSDIINDIKLLDHDKKILIINSYNNITSQSLINNKAIWSFVIDIAKTQDIEILKVTIDKLVNDNPDMNFIGLVRNALDQNIYLHDLSCFKTSNTIKKKS